MAMLKPRHFRNRSLSGMVLNDGILSEFNLLSLALIA
jgi:hypothetical protein